MAHNAHNKNARLVSASHFTKKVRGRQFLEIGDWRLGIGDWRRIKKTSKVSRPFLPSGTQDQGKLLKSGRLEVYLNGNLISN